VQRRRALIGSLVALALALSVLAPAAAGSASGAAGAPSVATQTNATNPCVGTVERPPNGTTVVSIQGLAFDDGRYVKRPALVVGFGPRGGFEYAYNATARGRFWAYDVDPLPSGELLLASTEPGAAVAETLDPATGERTAVERFARDPAVSVSNDVDRLPNGKLLVADATPGNEGLLVYDPRTGTVDWTWRFEADGGFPRSGGGEYPSNWVNVNDVDRVAPGEYLASARNFDQVLVVNRSTDAVTMRLGADDEVRTLDRPSNPQLLRGADGQVSILVADGRNDRVVEYTRTPSAADPDSPGGENWTLTWSLVGGGLNEPRDADRLPNGNTLVVDRRGHRTMEVTPAGRVVWEVYAPWQPYDVERVALGDEPGGPPATTFETNRTVPLADSASFDQARVADCATALQAFAPTAEERLLGAFGTNASDEEGVTPGEDARSGLRTLAFGGVGVVLAAIGAFYVLRE
jgi:hypothetical protein